MGEQEGELRDSVAESMVGLGSFLCVLWSSSPVTHPSPVRFRLLSVLLLR